METEYIDFLLVEKQDGSVSLVVAESNKIEVGYLVEFDNGKLGTVVKKAWGNVRGGEMHELIAALIPTYEAEAAYWRSWKKEANNGAVSGNP